LTTVRHQGERGKKERKPPKEFACKGAERWPLTVLELECGDQATRGGWRNAAELGEELSEELRCPEHGYKRPTKIVGYRCMNCGAELPAPEVTP